MKVNDMRSTVTDIASACQREDCAIQVSCEDRRVAGPIYSKTGAVVDPSEFETMICSYHCIKCGAQWVEERGPQGCSVETVKAPEQK